MADQVLALVYSDVTGKVTHSGLTGNVMPEVVARILSTLGIRFDPGAYEGSVSPVNRLANAKTKAHIITVFNERFDHDPNPYHATDNLTLTITSV